MWDQEGSAGVTEFIANSEFIAKRIKKFYGRQSKIIYPPVKTKLFSQQYKTTKQDFYLILSVLSTYKNITLAIKAFVKNGKTLVIAGDGPQADELRQLVSSSPNIKLVGRVSEAEKIRLLQQAKALIFPGVEDFGITPVEAMAASTPVVALSAGGVRETVIDKKTGIFFSQSKVSDLNHAIEQVEKTTFDSTALINQAQKFDEKIFESSIKAEVKRLMAKE